MNTIKRIGSLLLGMTLIMSMIYSCEDDNGQEPSINKEFAAKIKNIQQQIHDLGQGLEKDSASRQKLEEAEAELADAMQALDKNDLESCAYHIKLALGQVQQAAGDMEGQSAKTLAEILKGLQGLEDKMVPSEEKEGVQVTTKETADGKIFGIVTNFYAPVSKRFEFDPFGQLYWYQIDHFTKFDFATGKPPVDKDSDEWDFALAGNYMIINGGEKIKDMCVDSCYGGCDGKKHALGPHWIPAMTQDQCVVDKIQPERTGNAMLCYLEGPSMYRDGITYDSIRKAEEIVSEQPEEHRWKQDSKESLALGEKNLFTFSHGDYSYHAVSATLLFKTRDGKYAKLQFKDPKGTETSYSFQYSYNPSGSDDLDTSSVEEQEAKEHSLIINLP